MRRLLLAVLALLALAPATASAAPAVSGQFPTSGTLSGAPKHLAQGSDGNIWVVLDNNKIAKVTPAGAVTEYTPAPALNNPSGITRGPDGNLWLTQTNAVVKISPGNPTVDTPTTINQIGSPQGITTGPDNNLWTGSDANVIKIPPGNPAGFQSFAVVTSARGIARGHDGRLWVADFGGQRIVSVTTAGAPTSYLTAPTGGPMGTAAGPGTQIAFSDPIVQPEEVGLITPGGKPKRIVALGGSGDPTDIVFGNDGAYWFTRFGGNDLLRLTPGGQQTKLTGFSAAAGPRYLTKGPSNTLWVGLGTAKKVARITDVSAPAGGGGGGGGGGGDTTAPVISSVSQSHRTWHLGSALAKFARSPIVGTTFSFRVNEQSTTTFTFTQLLPGRRVGRRCLAPTRARRNRRRCTRLITVRPSLSYTTSAARHRLKFQGRLSRRK
ncbi:MAG: virginiamycin lyase, partial [Solirubrobacteraceae bacterium]|nr:virginiamycin lyase [Solirubrobacteraceae bacterium]